MDQESEELLLTQLATQASHRAEEPSDQTVWVIDDDIAVLALLKSVFGREGFAILTSASVAEASEAMPRGATSALVVLDFNIPGGSGLDILRKLRQQSDAPVMMVSNVKRAELVARAFELGANDFVEKPFDPRSLLVRARRLME
ncbi:MAG: response regulator [Trueperaceae bacterium]